MTTRPYKHQEAARAKSAKQEWFAQNGDMGTGKTYVLIAEAFEIFEDGNIDAAVVIAPKNVDSNWLYDQLPKHAPNDNWVGALWRSGPTVKQANALDLLSEGEFKKFRLTEAPKITKMKWLLVNWEAISTQRGFEFVMAFLEKNRCIVICDEAHRAKNKGTRVSKALLKFRGRAPYRRIATGTPVTNSPFDLYVPYTFLSPTIFGSSFLAFKSEFAKMIGPTHGLYHAIMEKMVARELARGFRGDVEILKERLKYRFPQIVAEENGKPAYRNLDRLRDLIEPYTFRVLKSECLDLPEKIFKKVYYDLTPEQMKVYIEAKDKLRIWLDAETIQPLTALTSIQKLQQISGGFYIETAEQQTHWIPGDNPKKEALKELLEDLEGKTIIWATYHAELKAIRDVCYGRRFVEYHGGVSDNDRENNKVAFQTGDAEIFIGNPKSGGVGLTLHAAQNMVYYSNTYSMDTRKQSEDRAHRIGQTRNLQIFDLVGTDTIDERIIQALQDKIDLAAIVNGDLLK